MSTLNCIRLNEIHPAPKEVDYNGDGLVNDNDEFIELFNTCDEEVSLLGFILDDIENGGSVPYTIQNDLKILPNSYYVIWKQDSKLVLNNTNEEVVLKDPSLNILDKFSYTSALYDKSYQFNENWGIWISAEPTPLQTNVSINRSTIEEITFDEPCEILARVVDVDTTYSGFYILQDDTTSIRVKINDLVFEKGKSYLILGSARELSKYNEFVVQAYIINELEFTELNLLVSEIDDSYLDMRICIAGAVSEVKDTNFTVTDKEGDSMKVYLEDASNVEDNKIVTACGILQYKYSKFQLTSMIEDITYHNVSYDALTQTGSNILLVIIGWILLLLYVILYRYNLKNLILWIKNKNPQRQSK